MVAMVGAIGDVGAEAVVGLAVGAFVEVRDISPRRISNSAVGPSFLPGRLTGKDAAAVPSWRRNRIPTSPVLAARTSSRTPMRRATWRAAPRMSTFCPSSRNRGSRSTTVVRQP